MKVLFVANQYQIGGATKSLLCLMKQLKEIYQVEPVVLIPNDGYLLDMCKQEKIKYIKLKYKPFVIGSGSTKTKMIVKKILYPIFKLQHFVYNTIALKKINKLIDMEEIDLIHTNVNRDDFGAMLSKKYDKPHIWHLREFGNTDYKCIFLKKNHIDFMKDRTNCFIAISNSIRDYFIQKGIDETKIKTIYNGVAVKNDFEKENSTDKLKILFMGGIQESKGQLQLVEALHLIPKDIIQNIIVDFYGSGINNYIDLLKKKIKEYNLENNVKINGYRTDIENIIKEYNVGVMCSRTEAFGRVTVEYMANKLITIASDTGANPEIIKEKTGFLYKYGNYQDLANIILKIYNMDEKEKSEIANLAFNRAKENFSVEQNTFNILKLYNDILKYAEIQ